MLRLRRRSRGRDEGWHIRGLVGSARGAFGGPSFAKLKVLAAGWVLAGGARTVTAALVASRVAGVRHHEAFHRFFSRAKWCPDEVGRLLFERLLPCVDNAAIEVVLDDTLAAKKGPKVFGLGTHLDAVRSTRRHRIFTFGHVWVVLAVRVKLPFSARPSFSLRYSRNKIGSAHAERAGAIVPPLRPWYTTKRGLSFEDILYAARAEMRIQPLFDPARASENLPNCRTPRVLRRARAA